MVRWQRERWRLRLERAEQSECVREVGEGGEEVVASEEGEEGEVG